MEVARAALGGVAAMSPQGGDPGHAGVTMPSVGLGS